MRNVSTEFKNAVADGNRNYNKYVTITLKDETVLDLDSSQIWEGGFKFTDGTTDSGNFTIGTVIIAKFTLMLNNLYDEFTGYDFDEAIVEPKIGLMLSENEEFVKLGKFTVDEPTDNTTVITLECLNNLSKFDVGFTLNWTYPITLQNAVQSLCDDVGVTLVSASFDGDSMTIDAPLSTDNRTNRQVLSFIMQMACKYAYCDDYGRLGIGFYDTSFLDDEDGYDGGYFDEDTPYSSGDDLDGGTLNPWSDGDSASGGTIGDRDDYHHFYSIKGLNRATQNIQITGVQVTEEFEETDDNTKQTVLYGEEGYVISIAENPLISSGKASAVATYIGSILVGMKFRPMSFSALGDPTLEAGDSMLVTDRKGNQYKGFATNYTYQMGSSMSVSCDAETLRENNASSVSTYTKIIQASATETAKQISNYDKAVQMLTDAITKSFGVFKTEEVLSDGSVIYYTHNKPLLSDSGTIWKQTADAFAVSTDGGVTWNAGIDSSGNAVVNVLSAIGVNADWISAGVIRGLEIIGNEISGGTINGTTITGTTINGNTISGGTISGTTITGATISGGSVSSIGTDANGDYSVELSGGKISLTYADGVELGGLIPEEGALKLANPTDTASITISPTGDISIYADSGIFLGNIQSLKINNQVPWSGTVNSNGVAMTYEKGILMSVT